MVHTLWMLKGKYCRLELLALRLPQVTAADVKTAAWQGHCLEMCAGTATQTRMRNVCRCRVHASDA